MPGVDNWMNEPLDIVQDIYDKHGTKSDSYVKDYFSEKTQLCSMIPSLNDVGLQELKNGCLVRYRCMVQDMYDPEFYLGAYEVMNKRDNTRSMRSGKYQDITQCPVNFELNLESDKNITRDRQTFYCVPIPGESAWVKHMYHERCPVKHQHPTSTNCSNKRGIERCDEDPADVVMNNAATESDNPCKKLRDEERERTGTNANVTQPVTDLNFPLPGEKGMPCLVKVYEDLDKHRVNEMVEFVGVLSIDPCLAHVADHANRIDEYVDPVAEAFPEEQRAKSPPPSLVPRLHAILSLPLLHNNPLLPPQLSNAAAIAEASSSRQKLSDILKHALFGDELAAQYLLCNLISSVYNRVDILPLGKCCINLINAPRTSQYAQLLHHLVANITTRSHMLEMSLENMNRAQFSPHKDYTTNRLRSGMLQLGEATHLILDETALQPGQLDVTGVSNVAALGTLIKWQKVEYDFRYHKQDFMTDVPVVILSEGTSLLPVDYHVPLAPQCDPTDLKQYFAEIDELLTPDTLNDIRRYLTVARQSPFAIDDAVQKVIQDDFVDVRKRDAASMTEDDFHSLLNLIRLLSLSAGMGGANVDLWNEAKRMETERKQRVLILPRPQT